MKKPTVLLTNDDGIHAEGLKSLWKGLASFCNPIIVAPSSEQSGVGACVTLRSPLHIRKISWEDDTPAWHVSGTPVDCVRMALRVLLPSPPDLIVSGINRGSNAGSNILYSGTVGGVIDGAMRGIPGIAFSSEDKDNPNFSYFEEQIFPLVDYLLKHPMPRGNFFNVTFPSSYKNSFRGYRLARQGLGHYKENPLKGVDPDGKEYYWMGCDEQTHEEHEESDFSLLKQGYTTVVPIRVSELTDHTLREERRQEFLRFFS